MSKRTLTRELYVLQTHRANLAQCDTFEAFKAAQLRFVDYLIKQQQAKDKADEALTEFATATAQWVYQVRTDMKDT